MHIKLINDIDQYEILINILSNSLTNLESIDKNIMSILKKYDIIDDINYNDLSIQLASNHRKRAIDHLNKAKNLLNDKNYDK